MATLNYNWQKLSGGAYVGSTGSLNVYIANYAKLDSQNTSTNKSYVSYMSKLIVEGSGSYFYTGSDTLKGMAATGISNTVQHCEGNYYKGETTLLTFNNVEIRHNDDGTASISMSSAFNSGPWGWNNSANDTATIPKINRYAVTNSVTGSNIEENFSVNYTKYISNWSYKLRISIPSVKELERINYPTSGTIFQLSKATIEELYDRYPDTNTFNLGFRVETWNGNTMLSAGNEKIISCTKVDRIGRLRINGEWKRSTPYVRVNGEWKKAVPYTRINNEWKRGR
jgi:hypothetical protein